MIMAILVHKKVDMLGQPIHLFLEFLKEGNLLKIKNDHNLFFKKTDNLKLIIEKLVFSFGQIIRVDEEGVLKGLLSIHDVIANFI